jgi:coenzyme F420 hydrogenase subunit beta
VPQEAGRSLVIVRTTAGAALLATAEVAGRIFIQPLETAAIAAMQPAQARRKKQILSHLAALILTGRPWPRYRGLRLWAAAARDNPVAQARSFAGLVRRLVQGRA